MNKAFFFVGLFVSFIAIIGVNSEECSSSGSCEALESFVFDCDCEKLLGNQITYPVDITEEQEIEIHHAYAAICAVIKCLSPAGSGDPLGTLQELLDQLLGDLLGGILGGGGSSGTECLNLPTVPHCSLAQNPLIEGTGEGIYNALNVLCNAQKCLAENGVDQVIIPDFGSCGACPSLTNPLGAIEGLLGALLCLLLNCVLKVLPSTGGLQLG